MRRSNRLPTRKPLPKPREGDAKAAGEPAVPTSEGVVSNDDRTLEDIVITGQMQISQPN
jgi:hypothetical protein